MKCDRLPLKNSGLSKVIMLRTKMRAIFLKNRLKKRNKLQGVNEYLELGLCKKGSLAKFEFELVEFEIKFDLCMAALIAASESKYFLKFLKFK